MFDFFVYYDENGNIYSITNELKSSGTYVKVKESDVSDFLSGVKDFKNFKVKITGKIEEKVAEINNLIYTELYQITEKNGQDLQIIIDNTQSKMHIEIKNENCVNQTLIFYLCKKDPNFLIQTVEFLTENKKSVFDIEQSTDLILLTKKVFDSYGIDYV